MPAIFEDIDFMCKFYTLFYTDMWQFLGEMQRIAFRLKLSSCVCVCVSVCLSVCLCVYAAFVDLRKTVWDRDVVF